MKYERCEGCYSDIYDSELECNPVVFCPIQLTDNEEVIRNCPCNICLIKGICTVSCLVYDELRLYRHRDNNLQYESI